MCPCIEGPFDISARQRIEQPLEKYFLIARHPADVEPWPTLLAKNSPGSMLAEIPVFLAQGANDVIVRPKVTQAYAAALCDAGSKCPTSAGPRLEPSPLTRMSRPLTAIT
jgi:hypothetical protein